MGDAVVTLTGNTTYSPWRVPMKNSLYIVPVSVGFYLSYTFGPQFDFKCPSYYLKEYIRTAWRRPGR